MTHEPQHLKDEPQASPLHVLEWAKAYIALAGSIATGLMALFAPETTVGRVLTAIVIIATAVSTWAVPNRDLEVEQE